MSRCIPCGKIARGVLRSTVCFFILVLTALPLLAQEPEITVSQAECLPIDDHGVLMVNVVDEPVGATVRVHFRRLDTQVEDFYYVVARSEGGATYWAVLPKAEDTALNTPGERATWAAWWRSREDSQDRGDRSKVGMLEARDWMSPSRDGAALQSLLEGFESQPTEYFATMVDATGELLAQSAMKLVPVRRDCAVTLSERQRGEAENLIVGETADWQGKHPAFRWQCAGIVTRIDTRGILAAHPCRSPFTAQWEEDAPDGSRGVVDTGVKQAFKTVEVFYGTDRRWEPGPRSRTWLRGQSPDAYGGGRGDGLDLGTLEVSIPLRHRLGELESPGFLEKEDPALHVVLLSVNPRTRQDFVAGLRSTIDRSTDKAAFIFIHGYNVSFENAARRSAQMSYDLRFDGAPILYSWPSQGSVAGYTVDEANIRWTVSHLQAFLTLVAKETGAETVHILAHSMGNRAVTEVLRRFALEQSGGPRFNQIVLVAPDVDAAVFRDEIAPAIAGVGKRVTLYASSRDKALKVSKGLHGHPRAGDLSDGMLIAPGFETIDASDVDTSLLRAIGLGHSYFADKPTVISDLEQLLAGKTAAGRGLRHWTVSAGGSYWQILPPR